MKHPIIAFLLNLEQNNNREWFHANREQYEEALNLYRAMVAELIAGISLFDASVRYLEPNECIFRIYRDVRFSSNKLPYKKHFGAYVAIRGGRKSIYSGYYLHLEPGKCSLSGGIYAPDGPMLKKLRSSIDLHFDELKAIVENPDFVRTFGTMVTYEQLQRVPVGYSKDHPAAEWLKYKHFLFEKELPDEALLAPDFMMQVVNDFKAAKPFNDFFNNELLEG